MNIANFRTITLDGRQISFWIASAGGGFGGPVPGLARPAGEAKIGGDVVQLPIQIILPLHHEERLFEREAGFDAALDRAVTVRVPPRYGLTLSRAPEPAPRSKRGG